MGFSALFISGCSKSSSSTQSTTGTVTDIDGNVYPTVTIGNQVWMAANLKTTKYRNGTVIPVVTDSIQWSTLTTAASCYANNDLNKVSIYGRFYNFYAVTDSLNNIAPTGWHVPTDADWTTLINYLGTSTAGGKLKSTGTSLWDSPNTGATNETGFNGIPGGDRSNSGAYHYMGMYACWWSTTAASSTEAWEYVLTYNSSGYVRMQYSKGLGLSVRCVKD